MEGLYDRKIQWKLRKKDPRKQPKKQNYDPEITSRNTLWIIHHKCESGNASPSWKLGIAMQLNKWQGKRDSMKYTDEFTSSNTHSSLCGLVGFWTLITHLSMSSHASHILLCISQSHISLRGDGLSPFPFTYNPSPKVEKSNFLVKQLIFYSLR